jgi:hypothetical protein
MYPNPAEIAEFLSTVPLPGEFGSLFGCVAPTRSSLIPRNVLLLPFIAYTNIKAHHLCIRDGGLN